MRFMPDPKLVLNKEETLDAIKNGLPKGVDEFSIKSIWLCDVIRGYEKNVGYPYNREVQRYIEKMEGIDEYSDSASPIATLIYNAQRYRRHDDLMAEGWQPGTPELIEKAARDKLEIELLGENALGGRATGRYVPKLVHGKYYAMVPGSRNRHADVTGRPVRLVSPPAAIKASAPAEGELGYTEVRDFIKKMRAGEASAAEIQEMFTRAEDNEQSILGSIMTKVNSQDNMKRKRQDTKEKIVKQSFEDMLKELATAGSTSFTWSPMQESLREAYRRMARELTDERLQKNVDAIAAHKAEIEKCLGNPETRSEFQRFISIRGADALTAEQKARYDELIAEDERKRNILEIERRARLRQIAIDAGMKMVETVHTRDRYPLFVVQLSERVDRDVFNELSEAAKRMGGWYSSYDKGGAVKGFQFKEKEMAERFMRLKDEDVSIADKVLERKEEKKLAAADRLQDSAERLEGRAEESLNQDRKTNTHRRLDAARRAESAARSDLALAGTVSNVADAIASGETRNLDGVKAVTHVETLNRLLNRCHQRAAAADEKRLKEEGGGYSKSPIWDREVIADDIEHAEYPYPHVHSAVLKDLAAALCKKNGAKLVAGRIAKIANRAKDGEAVIVLSGEHDIETLREAISKGKRANAGYVIQRVDGELEDYDRLHRMGIKSLPALRAALREHLQLQAEKPEADAGREAEREIVLTKIQGFFPTPAAIVDEMLQLAAIKPGMTVLEPGGGKGDIADRIRESVPDAELTVVEVNYQLCEILRRKGHAVIHGDFLQHQGQYHRIIMNPPFEAGYDIVHVRHAYECLSPGGRIVAILSEGAFYRGYRQEQEFREWMAQIGGSSYRLPDGAFLDSERPTGVSTRMIFINKAAVRKENAESVDVANAEQQSLFAA